jgi:hypothetical protein
LVINADARATCISKTAIFVNIPAIAIDRAEIAIYIQEIAADSEEIATYRPEMPTNIEETGLNGSATTARGLEMTGNPRFTGVSG